MVRPPNDFWKPSGGVDIQLSSTDSSVYGQVVEIIRTESTLIRCADALEPEAEAAELELPELDEPSVSPVISTLWPTCGDNFESSASRRYCVPLVPAVALRDWLDDEPAAADGLDDDVALVDPGELVLLLLELDPLEPEVTFVNMYPAPLELAPPELAVPAVPVAPPLPPARSRHPVHVMLRDDELCVRVDGEPVAGVLGFCDDGGFCAITIAAAPTVRAAHAPVQIRAFIIPPSVTNQTARSATVRPRKAQRQITTNVREFD